MQIMPATARWTARKMGVAEYKPEAIADRDMNLRLGTGYLKLVLDDFGGSQAMAAAAYNAGPNRPRRWREGGVFEAAAWAESIPFNETRDYVKKVLSNAVYYAALMGQQPPSLKSRLGAAIGPREGNSPAADTTLP
jgi:soluble lytic murein transglycosylase